MFWERSLTRVVEVTSNIWKGRKRSTGWPVPVLNAISIIQSPEVCAHTSSVSFGKCTLCKIWVLFSWMALTSTGCGWSFLGSSLHKHSTYLVILLLWRNRKETLILSCQNQHIFFKVNQKCKLCHGWSRIACQPLSLIPATILNFSEFFCLCDAIARTLINQSPGLPVVAFIQQCLDYNRLYTVEFGQ